MAVTMQQRRDTKANWDAINPIIPDGEIVFETDVKPYKEKVGDGITHWADLPYKDSDLVDRISSNENNIATNTANIEALTTEVENLKKIIKATDNAKNTNTYVEIDNNPQGNNPQVTAKTEVV